jgi:hypothetical protein
MTSRPVVLAPRIMPSHPLHLYHSAFGWAGSNMHPAPDKTSNGLPKLDPDPGPKDPTHDEAMKTKRNNKLDTHRIVLSAELVMNV